MLKLCTEVHIEIILFTLKLLDEVGWVCHNQSSETETTRHNNIYIEHTENDFL